MSPLVFFYIFFSFFFTFSCVIFFFFRFFYLFIFISCSFILFCFFVRFCMQKLQMQMQRGLVWHAKRTMSVHVGVFYTLFSFFIRLSCVFCVLNMLFLRSVMRMQRDCDIHCSEAMRWCIFEKSCEHDISRIFLELNTCFGGGKVKVWMPNCTRLRNHSRNQIIE